MSYLCRYGRLSIVEAMEMPRSDMVEFMEAVNELIGEENAKPDD